MDLVGLDIPAPAVSVPALSLTLFVPKANPEAKQLQFVPVILFDHTRRVAVSSEGLLPWVRIWT